MPVDFTLSKWLLLVTWQRWLKFVLPVGLMEYKEEGVLCWNMPVCIYSAKYDHCYYGIPKAMCKHAFAVYGA